MHSPWRRRNSWQPNYVSTAFNPQSANTVCQIKSQLIHYKILDLMPKGRNETGPNHNLTDWVRHHDRYESGGHVAATGRYVPASGS